MKTLHSFKYAFKGIAFGLEEYNMKFHIVAALVVILLGIFFSITVYEWIAILLSIGLVIMSELFNTAIEAVCDLHTLVHSETYPKAGKPKDIGAGAVLVAAGIALAVGLLVFIPYIVTYFK